MIFLENGKILASHNCSVLDTNTLFMSRITENFSIFSRRACKVGNEFCILKEFEPHWVEHINLVIGTVVDRNAY